MSDIVGIQPAKILNHAAMSDFMGLGRRIQAMEARERIVGPDHHHGAVALRHDRRGLMGIQAVTGVFKAVTEIFKGFAIVADLEWGILLFPENPMKAAFVCDVNTQNLAQGALIGFEVEDFSVWKVVAPGFTNFPSIFLPMDSAISQFIYRIFRLMGAVDFETQMWTPILHIQLGLPPLCDLTLIGLFFNFFTAEELGLVINLGEERQLGTTTWPAGFNLKAIKIKFMGQTVGTVVLSINPDAARLMAFLEYHLSGIQKAALDVLVSAVTKTCSIGAAPLCAGSIVALVVYLIPIAIKNPDVFPMPSFYLYIALGPINFASLRMYGDSDTGGPSCTMSGKMFFPDFMFTCNGGIALAGIDMYGYFYLRAPTLEFRALFSLFIWEDGHGPSRVDADMRKALELQHVSRRRRALRALAPLFGEVGYYEWEGYSPAAHTKSLESLDDITLSTSDDEFNRRFLATEVSHGDRANVHYLVNLPQFERNKKHSRYVW
jgi:hypothetical protein